MFGGLAFLFFGLLEKPFSTAGAAADCEQHHAAGLPIKCNVCPQPTELPVSLQSFVLG